VHLKLLSAETLFSPKCTKYRLAAALRPNPLEELTALPQVPWIKGPTSKGGATVLKVGGGTILRVGRAKKFLTPHFLASGGGDKILLR